MRVLSKVGRWRVYRDWFFKPERTRNLKGQMADKGKNEHDFPETSRLAVAIRWPLLFGAGISVALVVQLRKFVVCLSLLWAGRSQIRQCFFNSYPQRARKRALIPIRCKAALILCR